ncbi:MAG: hypothetical protein DRH32_09545 [Deltaproteobacteria bacterium]|nr:MAG: hypothetical protein DRH32_09545 [Deltaproteobacteria bacterium]
MVFPYPYFKTLHVYIQFLIITGRQLIGNNIFACYTQGRRGPQNLRLVFDEVMPEVSEGKSPVALTRACRPCFEK